MTTAEKTDPALWAEVIAEVRGNTPWNARKAQRAVQIYKQRGGKYRSRKSRENSLAIWTAEDWGYIDGKPGNRYLPAGVRKSLSRKEARTENRRKKSATRKGKNRASYSASVAAKLRKSRKSRARKSRARKSRKSKR
jgi:hypothetical protein